MSEMISQLFFFDIPTRAGVPSTKIFVKIVAFDEESLKTKPYIFIFPGGPGANHSHYEKDYSCLSTHGNIVFCDPRGCGLSSKGDPVTYTMDNHIDDVEEVRQSLGLKNMIVLGKSCGAMAALGFVVRYSAVVSKLILSASAPSFRFLETAKANVLTRGTLRQQEVCEKLWAGSFSSHDEMNEYFRETASLYSYKIKHGFPVPPQSPPEYPFSYECLNRGFGDFLRTFNFEDQCHLIQCPTLILAAEEDWITDKTHSEWMAEQIPRSQLVVFSESSHKMELDVPEDYFDSISAFIK